MENIKNRGTVQNQYGSATPVKHSKNEKGNGVFVKFFKLFKVVPATSSPPICCPELKGQPHEIEKFVNSVFLLILSISKIHLFEPVWLY
jgi:hypothetical protein